MNVRGEAMKTLARIVLPAALSVSNAFAGEGGVTGYMQGTYNDFLAGVFGPAGFYVRNDVAFYEATAGIRPLGGRVVAESEQKIWLDVAKVVWLTDAKILGARYGAAATIPVIMEGDVTGGLTIGPFQAFLSGEVHGVGDIYLNPIILNWTFENHHFSLAPAVTVPTGGYDVDRLLNPGRNYWSADIAGSYTWYNPASGAEISVTAGAMFNWKNPDTDYKTGNELHVDWLVGQHLSDNFAIAAVGYFSHQIEADNGSVAGPLNPGDFKGQGVGIGPAIMINLPFLGTNVSLIGKALYDVSSRDRFNGDIVMVSAAFKF